MSVGILEHDALPAARSVERLDSGVFGDGEAIEILQARRPEADAGEARIAEFGDVGHGGGPQCTGHDPPLARLNDGEAEIVQEGAHFSQVRRAKPNVGDVLDFDDAH